MAAFLWHVHSSQGQEVHHQLLMLLGWALRFADVTALLSPKNAGQQP